MKKRYRGDIIWITVAVRGSALGTIGLISLYEWATRTY